VGAKMKVLVACEYSGTVRDAFIARGHDAMSCDLLPTDSPGPHYQGDVFDIIDQGWDLMIAHPPCTYLTYAGTRHWNKPGRAELREEGLKFFLDLAAVDIPKIALENPVGYVNTVWRKPDQIIHPYYFGEPVQKRTCLWLKNLPLLDYSKTKLPKPEPVYICKGEKSKGKKINWCEAVSSSKDNPRWKIRSTTFKGIAEAMAEQWGKVGTDN
jgi:hypothetical protein